MTKPVIYFDHAATSWPKPPQVRRALDDYFGPGGGNPGRSGHRMSIAASRIVEEARDALGELLNAPDAGRIALTKNATEALNIAIYGLVRPGDHAVTTSLEHNSVMRPLRDLESRGVELTVVPGATDGTIDPDDVDRALRGDTRLLVTVHGSNVTGAVVPISDLATMARERAVPYLVDASQTAGSVPIDVTSLGVDMLAFTGHKALLGPTGTGGLYLREGVAPGPLLRGGTGSRSDEEVQPDFMPDRYEAGTVNVAGLAGLAAGARYLLDAGVAAVRDHERGLVTRFLEGARRISGLTVYGPRPIEQRCGVVSFNVAGLTSSDVGTILDRDYGILSRPGLHCAPRTHRTIGTFPTGTVRFGFGFSNTVAEVDQALGALEDIAAWALATSTGGGDRG
jgi:cysteine desulfurase/selenocysteine lyase